MLDKPKNIPAGSFDLMTHVYDGVQIRTFLSEDHSKFFIFSQGAVIEMDALETLDFGLHLSKNAATVLNTLKINTSIDKSLKDGMVFVEGGTFRSDDKVECTLSDFTLGKYPVTFEEYDRYCEAMKIAKPGDEGWGRGKRPVINVSWFNAVAYCNWLSEMNGLSNAYKIETEAFEIIKGSKGFRLPTEAEWEYAARGGNKTQGYKYSGSNTLADVGWYAENSDNQTHPVGVKKANELGLYDMSGNVWEWCYDSEEDGNSRVWRGGAWISSYGNCSVSRRSYGYPRDYVCGFRLAQDK